ncbi:hypothetical protein [Lysobacter enzymogenes]|uniref:hypothetical protein n=1 Tax=Lysobacter enzymogenes TaxID=69 RepID=UPI00099D2430|nr:hypothetical protein [Lysobacter enzymogenes]UZW62949.1 hypothetical protein BV903_011950 [Lysobacter enzymogenes]
MPTAASIIEALQRRLRLSLRRDSPEPGQFPSGWQHWLDAQSARPGAVTGATSDAWTAVFVERPLAAPPRRAPALNRWQAFATLWRQQWLPPEPEDRRLRWGAGVVSLFWHLLFGGLLVWLMYLQYFATQPPPRGETVTMIEYVGKGTPQEPGGGPQQPSEQPQPSSQAPAPPAPPAEPAPAQAAQAEPVPPAQVAMAAPPTPQLQAQLPDVAVRDVPEPQVPPPTVEQPVMVSKELPDAPQVFVLPPTRKRVDESLRAPQIQAAEQPLRSAEVPAPVQPPSLPLPQRQIAAPDVNVRQRELTLREVPAPVQAPALPSVRELPQRPVEAPQLRVAEIPTPPAPSASPAASAQPAATPAQTFAPAAPSATAATPAPSSSSPAAARTPAAGPSAAAQTPPTASAGAGPKPAAAPGSWPTPKRGDDWGDSARNRPGGGPGLYNADGSPRIADAPGSASPGFPPGTVTEEIKNLDRAGTWLKRKPTDYEPTTLDKYWRPNETLLAEWVRRSVKNVMIPIPGTSKRIQCSVALLMLGGGCGISDPNLNEQPAEARPPPDVPFKPHLQEDNGSVRPPPGG